MASFTRPLAERAVHLRITPRPSNLGESREIMRLISQFGEIEYFKNLKYDTLPAPNAALVIYKEESAAQACLKRSPIRFRMGKASPKQRRESPDKEEALEKEQKATVPTKKEASIDIDRRARGPIGTPFGMPAAQSRTLSTSSLPRPPPNQIRMPFDPPPPADPPSSSEDGGRIFQIQTNPSFRNFRDHIDLGHYHGSFAIDSKMPGQEDLAKKVPILGQSCVDWRSYERPWGIVSRERRQQERISLAGMSLGGLMKGRRQVEKAPASSRGPVGSEHGVSTADRFENLPHESTFMPFGISRRASANRKGRGNGDDAVNTAAARPVAVQESDMRDSTDAPTESEDTGVATKGWERVFPGTSNVVEKPKRYSGR